MTKEEYQVRLMHLQNLLEARFLDLGEYVSVVNKIQKKFYSQQVLKNTNLCPEVSPPTAKEHMDDIWSYTTISTKHPYYDAKSNSYKLLLKPLN